MSAINTHIVQCPVQPRTQNKFPVRTSAGHKTPASIPAELLTGDLRSFGAREAFRTVLNEAFRKLELRPGDSPSQRVCTELERQVATLHAGYPRFAAFISSACPHRQHNYPLTRLTFMAIAITPSQRAMFIDLLTVKVGKKSGVFLEGEVRAEGVFMLLTATGARDIAADLERAADAIEYREQEPDTRIC